MSFGLDTQRLSLVFQSRPDIIDGVKRAADSPSRIDLFNKITSYVHDQLQAGSEPALKRRRVEVATTNGTTTAAAPTANAADEPVLLEIKEISVSVPQRKKFDICFTKGHIYARAPGTTGPVQGMVYAWENIEFIFRLPVPEKQQVQHNYVIFMKGSCLPMKNEKLEDPFVFTIPDTPPKTGSLAGPNVASASSVADTYSSLFDWAFTHFPPPSALKVVKADPQKFHSVLRQPQRPNEKAVHVKAFQRAKDGYLFFLENGILWGFKKPLLFIPLERIAAVSYTSVLQRTFDMVVEVFTSNGESTEEIEFAMIDQEDYAGIDEKYVKRNGLQDRSMADRRKAKLELPENSKKKAGDGGNGAGADGDSADGMTHLERAQMEDEQRLQDEEDEEEEDYDPGSEGDSDGSGESEDDDDDDDDDDDEEGDDGGDGEEGDEEEAEENGGEEEEEEGAEDDAHHQPKGFTAVSGRVGW